MNTVHSIQAYRLPESLKLWGFDDERHGLRGEPFLWAASDFITAVVGENCRKAHLLFSEHPFPGANCKLTRTWTGSHYERAGRVRIPIGAPYGKPSGLDQRLAVPSHDQLLQQRTGPGVYLRGGLVLGVSFVRQTSPHSLPFFAG